jgi:hypothetical protein
MIRRIGKYIDEVLFGAEDHREVEWASGALMIFVALWIVWELCR